RQPPKWAPCRRFPYPCTIGGMARGHGTPSRGFTLIELMVAVAIIGVLASVALPGYEKYVKNVRSSEAINIIGALHRGAQAYFERPLAAQGIGAGDMGMCIVPEVAGEWEAAPSLPPTPEKRSYDYAGNPTFHALGFTWPPTQFSI